MVGATAKRTYELVEREPLLEEILQAHRNEIGANYAGYRGHVYRVFNLSHAFVGNPEARSALAVAAAFHDIGIWSDRTFDYLEPSARRARNYLDASSLGIATNLVEQAILQHHRLRSLPDEEAPAEALRRADLIDLSFGLVRFGLPRPFVADLRRAFPNAGFHRCLLRVGCSWALRHPLRPLPMLRW
ncbi:MAG TPA: hypothetical protein VLC09_21285 [Polyangiaceae bacterium]|nr:hypothetical protein [Polyangiaceae bacterium]